MSRVKDIEREIKALDGGRFQTLANQYLLRRYDVRDFVPLGSHFGTDKTTIGVPDAYALSNGKYIFFAYTTASTGIKAKLIADAKDCLDETKIGVASSLVGKIILCHNRDRLSLPVLEEVR